MCLSVRLFFRMCLSVCPSRLLSDCPSVRPSVLSNCLSHVSGPEDKPDVSRSHTSGHCHVPGKQTHTSLQMVCFRFFISPTTVEPVLRDHPFCPAKAFSQDRSYKHQLEIIRAYENGRSRRVVTHDRGLTRQMA